MLLPRILLSLLIALAGSAALSPASVGAAIPSPTPTAHDVTHPRIMQEAAQKEATAAPRTYAPVGAPAPRQAYGASGRLNREVFGFAYGSSLGDPSIGYPSWDFSLLSTVAYFGIHVSYDGGFIGDFSWSTWDDPNGPLPGLISLAHANGVKVVMTIILQDFDSQHGTPTMCSGLVNYQRTIAQTLNQVRAKPIDGINIDYEGLNGNCYDTITNQVESLQWMLVRFVRALRQALPSGQYLSIDTYSGSAGDRSGSTYYGFFDIGQLGTLVDSFFIMAYDMEYSNWDSPPLNCASFCLGPTSPLTTYLYNDTRAITEYAQVVAPSKVILGVPYYGRKECVTSGTPSTAPPNAFPISNTVAADGYLDASTENGYYTNSDYHSHRDANDPAGSERWDTWSSSALNCTREMYWDDVVSLGKKYDLVNSSGVRGIGIWTLSYGGGASELWNLIANRFGACRRPTLNASPAAPRPTGTIVTLTAGDADCASPQFAFWVRPRGGSWSLLRSYDPSPTVPWNTSGLPGGAYDLDVWVRQASSPNSSDAYALATYVLALCGSPSLSVSPAAPQPPGTSVTLSATAAGCSNPEFAFWVQPFGGAWSLLRGYGPTPTLTWNTAGLAAGTYALNVWVRAQGSPNTNDDYAVANFSLSSCSSATLAATPSPPQPPGTAVTVTASAAGCFKPEYALWVMPPGGSWSLVRGFGSSPTFSWITSGLAAGLYQLDAWVRESGSTSNADTIALTSYELG
ncbi:MAG TPA: glycosyl hydrolase family 18 protein, partial [Candidatus Acidoferrales bacterium]|nr:glycosyl hydrolase family 18 protein [Candidatus Acidoferrales bacterium]